MLYFQLKVYRCGIERGIRDRELCCVVCRCSEVFRYECIVLCAGVLVCVRDGRGEGERA